MKIKKNILAFIFLASFAGQAAYAALEEGAYYRVRIIPPESLAASFTSCWAVFGDTLYINNADGSGNPEFVPLRWGAERQGTSTTHFMAVTSGTGGVYGLAHNAYRGQFTDEAKTEFRGNLFSDLVDFGFGVSSNVVGRKVNYCE